MFKKRFSMMTVLVACLCAIVVTLGAIFYSMERITGDALGSLKFLKTLVLVREKFVEQPSDGKLFDEQTGEELRHIQCIQAYL